MQYRTMNDLINPGSGQDKILLTPSIGQNEKLEGMKSFLGPFKNSIVFKIRILAYTSKIGSLSLFSI